MTQSESRRSLNGRVISRGLSADLSAQYCTQVSYVQSKNIKAMDYEISDLCVTRTQTKKEKKVTI